MKKIFVVIFLLNTGCSESASKSDFLAKKQEYFKLYGTIAAYDFEVITLEAVDAHSGIDTEFIKETMVDLGLRQIQKLDNGIYFITGDSVLGHDGYFRSVVPRDSLAYYTILDRIVGDWYHWYQD